MLELLDQIIGANLLGFTIVFIAAFLESMFAVGMFIPGQTVVMLAGVVARNSSLHLRGFIFYAAAGAIVGDLLSYEIGRRFGKKILPKYIKKKYIDKTETFLKNHGGKSIILGRFHSILRAFIPFISGIHKMSYRKFLTYNIISGILWSVTFVSLGFIFGLGIKRIEHYLGAISIVLIIVFFVAFHYFESYAENKIEKR